MTTIATDGHSMAGDGRMCSNNQLIMSESVVKVVLHKSGDIIGFAGAPHNMTQMLAAYPKTNWYPKGEFSCLILKANGKLLAVDENLDLTPVEAPCAVGSGAQIAIGAMMAGASPMRAVELARERDVLTGGQISVVHRDSDRSRMAETPESGSVHEGRRASLNH